MSYNDRDVIIIGAGVDGLLSTYLAAAAGYRVTTFVRTSSARGATYNNQAWFQSGLLYAIANVKLGRLVRYHGPRLLREFGIPPSSRSGVFRTATDAGGKDLKRAADALAIDTVELLAQRDARQLLGPYYREDLRSYLVPDGPFPEAELMRVIWDAAVSVGAEFIPFPDGVVLKPMLGSPREFYVETPDGNYKAGVTLLCAGAFTNALLRPLCVRLPGLTLFRSPLMRIPDEPRLRLPLLVDIWGGGLSILRHTVQRSNREMGLVIGNGMRTVIDSIQPIPDPIPTQDEEDSILLRLPHAPPKEARLAHCCYKAEMLSESGQPSVEPWAKEIEDYCGLFAGGAGKATLGLHAAEELFKKAGLSGGPSGGSAQNRGPDGGSPRQPGGGIAAQHSFRPGEMWYVKAEDGQAGETLDSEVKLDDGEPYPKDPGG